MSSIALESLSILVADDEESIRHLLCTWLTNRGHKVVAVSNAQDATQCLREQRFNLVITDVVMPDGDGFELIGAFRKAQAETRILAISGGGRFLQGNDCLKIALGLGAHAVLMKPFGWDQLQAGIDQALLATESNAA